MTKELNHRNGLWLGTKRYMRWVPAPRRGASASSAGFSEDATGKNGGGYVSQSFGRHKGFQYDWSRGTPREYANFLQGLRDGTYGRGVLHFTDPTSYQTNVLSPHWANPGMALGYEAPPLVFRQDPEAFDFGTSDRDNTPLIGAVYRNVPTVFDIQDAFFVAIPPGMDFLFGSRYTSDAASVGIYLHPVLRDLSGTGVPQMVPRGIAPVNPFRALTTERISGVTYGGVYVWIGRTGGSASHTVSILDMVGMLVPQTLTIDWQNERIDQPWYGGEGHSGCVILGQPTIDYDSNDFTSVSATFKEVGAWELASRL